MNHFTFQAQYSDGRSAVTRQAVVTVASGGLLVQVEGGTQKLWLYSGAKLTHHQPVRIERGLEWLVIADTDILRRIEALSLESFRQLQGDWSSSARNWVGMGAVGVIVIALAVWFEGIPLLAAGLASLVPVRWEERLGQTVSDSSIAQNGECVNPQLKSAMEEIVGRLDKAQPSRYRFRVRISKSQDVNAFAAPGGYVVVLRGLIQKADSPEEVAGVLAHEMVHVRERHVTRGMMRSLSIYALTGIVVGDAGALGRLAESMGSLRFQRQDETAADREGIRNLASAGIAPDGMIAFFEKLTKQDANMPVFASYLSTHPDTQERLEELKRIAATLTVHSRPLKASAGWGTLRDACE